MKKKRDKPPTPSGMTFEEAMKPLRAGKPIRRRAWALESRIFRLGADVFCKLPSNHARAPGVWHPYPEDFLSKDWALADEIKTVTRPGAHMKSMPPNGMGYPRDGD